jgi:putative spermidine/putrescine transport system substrate-binding protein
MMSIWNARASELKQQGRAGRGGLEWSSSQHQHLVVLKGAPNRKLAWELIAFASQAKPQAEFNTRLFYGPIHPEPMRSSPKDIAVQLPTYEDNQAISVREDDQWEADRIVQIEQRFTQWLAS